MRHSTLRRQITLAGSPTTRARSLHTLTVKHNGSTAQERVRTRGDHPRTPSAQLLPRASSASGGLRENPQRPSRRTPCPAPSLTSRASRGLAGTRGDRPRARSTKLLPRLDAPVRTGPGNAPSTQLVPVSVACERCERSERERCLSVKGASVKGASVRGER